MPAGQLERIKIEGFRSIRALDLELGPINILIGANGSGKSNFLSFFDFYRQFENRNLAYHVSQQGGADNILHFGAKQTKSLNFEFDFAVADEQRRTCLVPTVADTFFIQHEKRDVIVEDEKRNKKRLAYPPFLESGNTESGFPLDDFNTKTRNWRRYHFHDTGETA